MTMSVDEEDAVPAPAVQPWRFFDVEVAAATPLTRTFVRITFTGKDLHQFADNGWDQRFKVVLPAPEGGFAALDTGPDWYAAWRLLDEHAQPPIRTYTVRAVRPEAREVDVDMVLHGETGPASRFAANASVGDRILLLGPDARHAGEHGGLEFRPPADHVGPTLLAGDETAVPALLAILEQLPSAAHGEAVLEVPSADDVAPVVAPDGMRVTWLVRPRAGTTLPDEVRSACRRIGVRGGVVDQPVAPDAGIDAGADEEPVWDVPAEASAGFYAWLAGESGVITGLRRHLVRDLGVDRRQVAFMGYWRHGRPG